MGIAELEGAISGLNGQRSCVIAVQLGVNL
jgi:hypothetical protein